MYRAPGQRAGRHGHTLARGGVAVVYFVSTVEGARRRGIGAPIALAALCEARGIGRGVGVLGSSPMGYSVYRGLGLEELCRIEIYEWRPSA